MMAKGSYTRAWTKRAMLIDNTFCQNVLAQ